MGQGIDLAALDNPVHAALIDNLKDQLLIAFVNKFGGKITLTVEELDKTGNYLLGFRINQINQTFEFKTENKQ